MRTLDTLNVDTEHSLSFEIEGVYCHMPFWIFLLKQKYELMKGQKGWTNIYAFQALNCVTIKMVHKKRVDAFEWMSIFYRRDQDGSRFNHLINVNQISITIHLSLTHPSYKLSTKTKLLSTRAIESCVANATQLS